MKKIALLTLMAVSMPAHSMEKKDPSGRPKTPNNSRKTSRGKQNSKDPVGIDTLRGEITKAIKQEKRRSTAYNEEVLEQTIRKTLSKDGFDFLKQEGLKEEKQNVEEKKKEMEIALKELQQVVGDKNNKKLTSAWLKYIGAKGDWEKHNELYNRRKGYENPEILEHLKSLEESEKKLRDDQNTINEVLKNVLEVVLQIKKDSDENKDTTTKLMEKFSSILSLNNQKEEDKEK